jgi:Putative transposase
VRVLSRLFRRLFLELLRAAFERKALKFVNAMAPRQDAQAFEQFLAPVASAVWVVYAKAPFGGSEQVLEYLGLTRIG